MASSTTNLGLTLPVGGENVSRQIINENNTTIDSAIGALPTGKNVQGQIDEIHTVESGKADKVSGATNGNFAGLDGNGNLTDSGKKAEDFALVSDIATEAETQTMIDDYYGG